MSNFKTKSTILVCPKCRGINVKKYSIGRVFRVQCMDCNNQTSGTLKPFEEDECRRNICTYFIMGANGTTSVMPKSIRKKNKQFVKALKVSGYDVKR